MKNSLFNLNLIVDTGRIQKYYFENYTAIKHVVFTYVTVLLAKNLFKHDEWAFNDLKSNDKTQLKSSRHFQFFKIENNYYDLLLHDLVNNVRKEETVVSQSIENINFSTHVMSRVLDDLHDALDTSFRNAVFSVMNNRASYINKSVLINVILLNQHTLIVSFKTVGNEAGIFETQS